MWANKVNGVSDKLEGITKTWYKIHVMDSTTGAPKLMWDELKAAFVDRFLLESVRDAKAY